MNKLLLFLLGAFCASTLYATLVEQTVYINRGFMEAVDGSQMPYYAFNSSETFDQANVRIALTAGDSLSLTIVNTDELAHAVDVINVGGINGNVAALETVTVTVHFPQAGAYIFYDPTDDQRFRQMGLAGMLIVYEVGSTATPFFWNLKEHQVNYNEALDDGLTVDWSAYKPDYFTINGNSNPDINQDSAARVVGGVGDTIHIYITNTGQSVHSIHFHGYHCTIVQSSRHPEHVGRSKDTVPVYSMEVIVLELVPDQPGEYPVHDHNLVAVSGGNIYPNGMFLTMLVE